ncbi:MAG: FxsA family protein [Magnetococcales bacterium]|nr:FxsA family protein [Magnetococcales bacterium]NGZ26333.1 FxsA family protein [Magnetococcales bacterium]
MILLGILLFIFAEFYGIGQVMDAMGVLETLVALILIALIGIQWTKAEGIATLTGLVGKLHQNQGVGLDLVEGGLLLLAGLLFAFPGFLSDILALLLLIPFVRQLAAMLVVHYWGKKMQTRTAYTPAGEVILEGEVSHRQEFTTQVELQLPSPATEQTTPPPAVPR